jgi:hypothetical protein
MFHTHVKCLLKKEFAGGQQELLPVMQGKVL